MIKEKTNSGSQGSLGDVCDPQTQHRLSKYKIKGFLEIISIWMGMNGVTQVFE